MQEVNINVPSKEKTYKISIGNFSSADFKSELLGYIEDTSKILIIISEKVNKLWGKEIIPQSENFEIYKYVMKDGEKYKSFKTYTDIMKFALQKGLARNDCIIAIGGGVVGDIAGFIASTYMRGIRLIQIPTTLLACVDSSVGGKTGIDTNFGKNLIGTFYHPYAVLINVDFLKTLDNRQYKSGLAEVIKYALIEKTCASGEFINLMNFMNENSEKINLRDKNLLETLICTCIKLKKSVVEKDELETNLRKILNFGHTIAHALEYYGNYKKYTHGEAVAQGMIYIFEKAHNLGLITENYKFSALEFIEKFGFKQIKLPPMKKLISIMQHDKKNINGKITFVLPKDFGEVIIQQLDENEI